jgi:hypothetical protein
VPERHGAEETKAEPTGGEAEPRVDQWGRRRERAV